MTTSGYPVRTRLVICIDGTWCEPDGVRASGNQTNVYRTFASTKRGLVIDSTTNLQWNQEAVYYPGLGTKYIGTATNMRVTKQIIGGIFGKGYEQYLQDAYKKCCELGKQDEVWLFGFSRGAFVVRALAGMLYHLRVIKSSGKQWDKDYKEALLKYETIRRTANNGSSHLFLVDKTQPGPILKFVGAFDTVKALDDHDLHDAAFNPGIQHMRHAVALHENRRDMKPDLENAKPIDLDHRSFIQAWFVGAHMDLGGSKSHDGLSLYPLQWVLEESRSKGLVLGFDDIDGRRQIMVNPLELVFPLGAACHTFETRNKIKIRMTDITTIHSRTEGLQERYRIKVNSEKSKIWRREQRPVFLSDGQLSHYFNNEAFGTIVHPSVYFLLFHYDPSLLVLDNQESALQSRLAQIERLMLGRTQDLRIDHGFWSQSDDLSNPDKTWPVRILICGKAGVGKSTLINKVFGVATIAKTSARTRGEHEILEECKWEGRPDLIIHDSRGLEAASESEMKIVEGFLEESSSKRDPKDRLHVIWFCINVNDHRPKETSTTKMFDAIVKYAPNIPVIVVATHTDVLEDSECSGKQRSLMKQGRTMSAELYDECVAFSKERLESRIEQLDMEMREVLGEQHEAQMVACVGTSEEHDETVKELTRHTVECIDNEEIRLSCIAAQVTDIDIKVNAALKKVMAAYKRILWTSLGTGIVPSAAYVQRSALSIDACRKVFTCFGLPTVHVQTAYETLKRCIFDDMGGNLLVTFAEASATFGALASIFTFGGSIIATGTINAAILPPSNCRFYLVVACDLILILVRCFHEALLTKTGQPGNRELQRQCREYRFSGMPSEIHKQIKKIVPLHRIDECFRGDRVRKGIEDLVHENQEQIAISMSSHRQSLSSRNSSSDLSRLTIADSDLTLLAKEDVDLLLD